GPTGHWTKHDLVIQRQQSQASGPASGNALSESEPSLHEHLVALRDGVRTVVHHPQGYGLGNVGQTASRTRTPIKAGESNYTEMGAELALLVVALALKLEGHSASPGAIVADPARTPGVLNPDVTQATIRSTICTHGWTATIRPPVEYTNALKRTQMRAYGERGPASAYQE